MIQFVVDEENYNVLGLCLLVLSIWVVVVVTFALILGTSLYHGSTFE